MFCTHFECSVWCKTSFAPRCKTHFTPIPSALHGAKTLLHLSLLALITSQTQQSPPWRVISSQPRLLHLGIGTVHPLRDYPDTSKVTPSSFNMK
ncbi:hypothetical protein LguiB_026855 [Lonicera macranthoides]